MKLIWSNYKSSNGSLGVYFPGGFQLFVQCEDGSWKPTKRWRVWWGKGESVPVRGLQGKWFRTRGEAQRAAEAVFVPLALFAPSLVALPRVTSAARPTAAEAFRGRVVPASKKRKRA